jgi:hypothetical protein
VLYQSTGQGAGCWISCGPFSQVFPELGKVDNLGKPGKADRLSQADRLPQAGMQGMQEPVELPVLGAEVGSHPSLPPGNTRSLPM